MSHAIRSLPRLCALLLAAGCSAPALADAVAKDARPPSAEPTLPRHFPVEEKASAGSVTAGGERIDYRAVAGTLVIHPRGWDDVSARLDLEDPGRPDAKKPIAPEASMFYAAYFKVGAQAASRPVTFLFNGGPGSATVWLHMGAFGPRRVLTPGDGHVPAAPYSLVNNDYTLLDASDLVFIDAPGAGFSRIAGADKEKAFWGVDQDAHAFAEFIVAWLSKYNRWNSPKYLFGESYGTTRAAVLINDLETRRLVDFNGVVLLSQILNFSLGPDGPEQNPGVDLPYQLALPTYAATAHYHKRLGPDAPADLATLLAQVEKFALTDYALALQQGAALPEAERTRIANELHRFTGLPVETIRRANLRIAGGVFEKALQDAAGLATGRIDTRYSGPLLDPLEKGPGYDPFIAGIASAYVSAINDYARKDLGFGEGRAFLPFAPVFPHWELRHGGPESSELGLNVMNDLAQAMKYNPRLKVLLTGGYYDLATPYFEGVYEMKHLAIPDSLQANISYKFHESGHMVYVQDASLKALHDDVADFIRKSAGAH